MNKLIFGSIALLSLAACSSEESVTIPNDNKDVYFNVVLSTSATGNTETYVQAHSDLTKGSISFNGFGFEVPSTRTARVYASNNGKVLYNLNYGGGTILNFNVKGGQNYEMIDETNVAPTVGTDYPRWTKLNDEKALLHNVKTVNKFEEGSVSKYLYTESTATIVDVNLSDLTLGTSNSFVITPSENDKKNNLYVSRIDAPVILGGKAYYGLTKQKCNPAKPDETLKGIDFPASSLVVDYPSLQNPKLIESAVAKGSTYGYRIPVAHKDELGDGYQICKTHMLKLSDGKYDDSYVFDLSKAIPGMTINTLGWFYAGNGIGYATYFDVEKGDSKEAAAWGIVRLDIYKKTAVKMNTPAGLYLFQHQYAKVLDGKVYMALCPMGGKGNVYIFDSTKADANGFELGAELEAGAGASYIGIF